ncbi:MAG: selenocysteine lyase/cysteine desulfurase [Halieaceae bacterium]|jgi:selenocysteine lyase/cysteine desulfurase
MAVSVNLLEKIRAGIIGERAMIPTTFGDKPLVYADYTASGRSLSIVEDYIRDQVLPYYANTHTETSFTGAQTTALREQARDIIRDAVKAGEEDCVIFCGPGATAAINKLIDILNIRLPADLAKRHDLLEVIPMEDRPLVFVGPYEHHSNELPWRESIAQVEVIPLDENGQIDTNTLEQRLVDVAGSRLIIGSFSAASNVTGIKTNVDKISALLHAHGAYSLWDYAAAAPYVGIDMNPVPSATLGNPSKDAIFLSPHKFVGGPGTPGVLIVKKRLLNNSVPSVPGGGTVMYVTPEDHRFVADPEHREEGGTPAIVESIRAGLVFRLQQQVGTAVIEGLEEGYVRRAMERWSPNPNIDILGSADADRLSIFSVRLKHAGKDLHYAFVVALLNDLFGIQARGGCSCAGPYGHSLLGMDMDYSKALERELLDGYMVMRPGWVRLNFNYFIDEETFQYLLGALELVAEHGWRLLPYYEFAAASGCWRYQGRRMELVANLDNFLGDSDEQTGARGAPPEPLAEYLVRAEIELMKHRKDAQQYSLKLPESCEQLRWFVLPQSVLEDQAVSHIPPTNVYSAGTQDDIEAGGNTACGLGLKLA